MSAKEKVRQVTRKSARKDRWIARIDQAISQRLRCQLRTTWSEPNARDHMLLLNGFGQVVGEVSRNYYGAWRGWVLLDFSMILVGEYPKAAEAKAAVERAYRDAVRKTGRRTGGRAS